MVIVVTIVLVLTCFVDRVVVFLLNVRGVGEMPLKKGRGCSLNLCSERDATFAESAVHCGQRKDDAI